MAAATLCVEAGQPQLLQSWVLLRYVSFARGQAAHSTARTMIVGHESQP